MNWTGPLEAFSRRFAWWVSGASLLALVRPEGFAWFITGELPSGQVLRSGGFVTPGLQVIMVAMGLALRTEDLRLALGRWKQVAWGVGAQFTLMPLIGWGVARSFSLPEGLAAGLILMACCPGGTASNVIAFLARADLALSVAMTTVSTLLAAVFTPFASSLLMGRAVAVDVPQLYMSCLEVVVAPVLVGVVVRGLAAGWVRRFQPALPALAVVAITLIVAGILAVQRQRVLDSGFRLLGAVALVHGLAFAAGYLLARWSGAEISAARAISIEVGMQNSGLGVVLARASFADPTVAVTPALSAVVHCIYGSGLAGWWGRSNHGEEKDGPPASLV